MKKEYAEVCLNPTRQRILQVLISFGEATASQLGEMLSDIPRASLYRHLKILQEADAIRVVKEESRRGAVEKTYAFTIPSYDGTTSADMNALVQGALMSLSADFSRYFAQDGCDCVRDMLTVDCATLLLDDEEFKDFLQEYARLVQKVINQPLKEGRKERRIAFVSAPGNE